MDKQSFVEALCRGGDRPDKAEIFSVRSYNIPENEKRLKRMLTEAGAACQRSFERGDWIRERQRTLVRLPLGGRAEVYHASGALRVLSGLRPMEALFDRVEPRAKLEKLVRKVAEDLKLERWLGEHARLEFEHLWQIKAAAADRKGKQVEPVLCRAIGAFRQFVGRLPILGGASAAVKVAAGEVVDTISLQFLEVEPRPVATVALIPPTEAAAHIRLQLESLMGEPGLDNREVKIKAQPLRLGYLNLGKRKSQRLLAPHYFAEIHIEHEEAQAYLLVAPATEKIYQPLCPAGQDSPLRQQRSPIETAARSAVPLEASPALS